MYKISKSGTCVIRVAYILSFNNHCGSYSSRCTQDDRTLDRQVQIVNSFIRETNLIYRKTSPKFSMDLENSRKGWSTRARYFFRLSLLYLHGVHSIPHLARLWLLRICKLVTTDCIAEWLFYIWNIKKVPYRWDLSRHAESTDICTFRWDLSRFVSRLN